MDTKFRTCAVCGLKYSFCPKCRDDADKPLWYFSFCGTNCHDIYAATSQFENGQIDAETAKKNLDKLNLSKLDSYGTSYKKSINKIMSSVKEPVIEESIIMIETEVDDIDDEKNIKRPRTKKVKDIE